MSARSKQDPDYFGFFLPLVALAAAIWFTVS